MEKMMKRLGLARGYLENAEGFEQLKKALNLTLDAMDEIADELSKLSAAHDDLNEYVSMIDEDLTEIEDALDMMDDEWDDDDEISDIIGDEENEIEDEKPNSDFRLKIWKNDDEDK